jgi:hypothetical protein
VPRHPARTRTSVDVGICRSRLNPLFPAAQRLADEPRPDLRTATAARRRAQDATGTWRTASVRAVGSIGLLYGVLRDPDSSESAHHATRQPPRLWNPEHGRRSDTAEG